MTSFGRKIRKLPVIVWPLGVLVALAVCGCKSWQETSLPVLEWNSPGASEISLRYPHTGRELVATAAGNRESIIRGQSRDREQEQELPGTGRAGVTLDQFEYQRPPTGTPDVSGIVAEVVVKGNERVPEHRILANIRTRPGRYFDPVVMQEDVTRLWKMPEIQRVNGPYIEQTTEGVVVTVEVVEKRVLNKIEFVGNRRITDRRLKKEAGIEDGQPLDIFEVRMIKTRIEDYYREKGYPNTEVEILQGASENDDAIVLVIHEDEQQRIWNVAFEGNSIATDARLRTMVKSKPGILWMLGGLARRDEIDDDVQRLMDYYKSLGFFNARIGREVRESNDGRWLTTTFIIDEGPRYNIRNVSFMGNQHFTNEELFSMLRMKPEGGQTPAFSAAQMNQDVSTLRDLYGSLGYVFSNVEAEPRFLEQPGLLDLVYRIDEGKRYRVGEIKVHIDGNYGVTRRETVLNRLSLRPGDWVDIREIRNSERRLGSAQIFAGSDPGSPGAPPRIVVVPPELEEMERLASPANQGSPYR